MKRTRVFIAVSGLTGIVLCFAIQGRIYPPSRMAYLPESMCAYGFMFFFGYMLARKAKLSDWVRLLSLISVSAIVSILLFQLLMCVR